MRRVITVSSICFSFAANLYAAEPASHREAVKHSPEIGRYQLFQGTYTTLDLKYRQTSSTHNAVFLVDTVTGQVKRYVNRIDEDGRYIETWLPTDISQQLDIRKMTAPQSEGKTDK